MQLSTHVNEFITRKPLSHSKLTEMSPQFLKVVGENDLSIYHQQAIGEDLLKSRTWLYYIRKVKNLSFIQFYSTSTSWGSIYNGFGIVKSKK